MFFQDWGSLIGLRLVAAFPERFSRVVLSNGGLPAGPIPEDFAAPCEKAYKTLPVVKARNWMRVSVTTHGRPGLSVLA